MARTKETIVYPDRTVVYNPGDRVPPTIELDRAAEALAGGPVFEGTDVPVEFVHYYMPSLPTIPRSVVSRHLRRSRIGCWRE